MTILVFILVLAVCICLSHTSNLSKWLNGTSLFFAQRFTPTSATLCVCTNMDTFLCDFSTSSGRRKTQVCSLLPRAIDNRPLSVFGCHKHMSPDDNKFLLINYGFDFSLDFSKPMCTHMNVKTAVINRPVSYIITVGVC